MVVSALPTPALAFESRLAVAASQKLTMAVKLQEKPEYPSATAAAVVAVPSPVTVPGTLSRPATRLAAYRATTPQLPLAQPIQPSSNSPLVLEGEASFYSRAGCLGCNPAHIMANGQPLNDGALTMAIGADKKHLVGHTALVTNLGTGKSVTVKITDTGGFHHARYGSRVADLTIATKQAIGMNGGVGQVRVEVF